VAQIPKEKVTELSKMNRIEAKVLSDGTMAFAGPFKPDVWFDDLNECFRENALVNMVAERKRHGQNAQGQTPEQEKAFKERQKQTVQLKEKAKVLSEMAAQKV